MIVDVYCPVLQFPYLRNGARMSRVLFCFLPTADIYVDLEDGAVPK